MFGMRSYAICVGVISEILGAIFFFYNLRIEMDLYTAKLEKVRKVGPEAAV